MATKYMDEPPPMMRGKYERKPDAAHVKLASSAKRKPGKWIEARKFETAGSASRWAQRVRSGTYLAFQDGTYEATVRDKTVFIRFVQEV